eukprot:TRINITY_DN22827_c0_g1_i1.p2 TRINITY_DN22827_c0_g1~~TRINITY_DN22827_c0_g1_i1.p2  ORF type:complete len:123 (-),score=23.76 TRINITY_DN22827_c0_g1_i1:56-397(-)
MCIRDRYSEKMIHRAESKYNKLESIRRRLQKLELPRFSPHLDQLRRSSHSTIHRNHGILLSSPGSIRRNIPQSIEIPDNNKVSKKRIVNTMSAANCQIGKSKKKKKKKKKNND